ncbi:MAG: hypothetical protein ACI9U2_004118 [Bradymonadia bacterium]|jgi:hypothetical protein
MLIALTALSLLPRIDTVAEVAHDVGVSPLRGTIELRLDVEVVRAPTWQIEIFTTARTFIRHNTATESPVRISPRQVHYPVGIRLRWPRADGESVAVFAFHQSNHDVDTNDPVLNEETVSYEIYGAEYRWPQVRVHGGLYYDRGTRVSGRPQTLPFDYYLFGATVDGWHPVGRLGFVAGRMTAVAHRNADHTPQFLNIDGQIDGGLRWQGETGAMRVFLRGLRVEDYRFLGDVRHALMVGFAMGSGDL